MLQIALGNDTDWERYEPLKDSQIKNIVCYDSNNCYALVQGTGYYLLYKSRNQGESWDLIYESLPLEAQDDPIVLNIGTISNIDTNYIYLLGDWKNVILKSTNSGVDFEKITIKKFQFSSDFQMFNKKIGIIGYNDGYYRTFNGWETFERTDSIWYNKEHRTFGTYDSPIFLDSNNMICLLLNGEYDGNKSKGFYFASYNIFEDKWTTIYNFHENFPPPDSIYPYSIRKIDAINDSIIYAAGKLGNGFGHNGYDVIFKSSNRGKSWERQLFELHEPRFGLNDIEFYDENNGVALGQHGKIVLTNDGGKNWVYDKVPDGILGNSDPVLEVTWAGKTPLIGTWDSGLWRYTGNYFNFKEKLAQTLTIYPTCEADSMNSEINFDWGSVKDAVFYHFQLSLEPEMNSFIYEKKDFAKHSLKVSDLDSGQTYYWRVRGYNYDVVGDWSEVCSFSVVKGPNSVENYIDDIIVYFKDDKLLIDYKKSGVTPSEIVIRDLEGRQVLSKKLSGRDELIDLKKLAEGVYFYTIISDEKVYNNKFIVKYSP